MLGHGYDAIIVFFFRFVERLEMSGLVSEPGGVPASLFNSTPQHQQQWDFPNVWPPLVREREDDITYSSLKAKDKSENKKVIWP